MMDGVEPQPPVLGEHLVQVSGMTHTDTYLSAQTLQHRQVLR